MDRVFTHIAVDKDGWTVRKFLSKREADFFCSTKADLSVKSTGIKKKVTTTRDLYKKMLLECGECLF